MPGTAEIAAHRLELQQIVRLATDQFLARARAASTATQTELRSILTQTAYDLIVTHGEDAASAALHFIAAGRAGTPWYDQPLALADPLPDAQIRGALDWALHNPTDLDGTTRRVMSVMGRLIRQPARDTIRASADAAGTGWARVPTGARTCDFCLMLASRAAAYSSREAALRIIGRHGKRRGSRPLGARYHDDCDCTAVEIKTEADLPEINRLLETEWYRIAEGRAPNEDLWERWKNRDYENAPNGLAFGPSNRPTPTTRTWAHILDGETITAAGRTRHLGGHRPGTGYPGKTEFPPTWTDADIREAIELALLLPEQIRPRGSQAELIRHIDGVDVAVLVTNTSTPRIITAFPKPGPLVTFNRPSE